MLQEAVGRLREPVEEDVHRLVDLVIELVRDRIAEETVEQPAVGTPEIPVIHQRKGPFRMVTCSKRRGQRPQKHAC